MKRTYALAALALGLRVTLAGFAGAAVSAGASTLDAFILAALAGAFLAARAFSRLAARLFSLAALRRASE